MKVDIEQYRGWDILFDTDKETFSCYSNQWDRSESKQSFAATKKFIDDFIKDNNTFKTVWAESKPGAYNSDRKIKIIGIRKDGRLIYEDVKGEKKQLSDYNEKDYILYDKENEKHRIKSNEIQIEIDNLNKQKKLVEAKITGMELSEYKKQFIPLSRG